MQLESEQELVLELVQRRDELLSALDRVRGHVELGMRVIPDRDQETHDAPEAMSGRDYLLGLVGDHARAAILQRDLHGPLAKLATADVLRRRVAPPAILVAAYLVDVAVVAKFRRLADELSERHRHVHIAITGPWPPYSFAATEEVPR
jgi:hypothetical protein